MVGDLFRLEYFSFVSRVVVATYANASPIAVSTLGETLAVEFKTVDFGAFAAWMVFLIDHF
jgi:hypothetical protein